MGNTPSIHAVFCGKVCTKELFLAVLEPYFALRDEGLIRSLIFSTWQGEVEQHPGLSEFFASNGIGVIESVFPKQLEVKGRVFEQVFTLDRALDTLDEDDLVFRTRSDVFIQGTDALRDLLAQDLPVIEPTLPPVFRRRVWVAAFHPMIPYYLRDQIFYGTVADLRKLGGYDLLVEAYGIKGRPHEFYPHHSSGAAPEVRRFMAPFLPHFPALREYQFIWPKLCIGTQMFQNVVEFNYGTDVYREHLALYLYLVHHYFKVGGVPALNQNVALLGYDDEDALTVRSPLCFSEEQWRKELGIEDPRTNLQQFSYPVGMFPNVTCEDWWLQDLFDGLADPGAPEGLLLHLKRAMEYRHGPERNRVLEQYLQALYQLADAA